MTDTTMTNGSIAGFDVPFVHTRDLGATWRGLLGVTAGTSGKPSHGLPHLLQLAGGYPGQGLQGPARVNDLCTDAGKGTRVSESGALARERRERVIDLVEATPRYGAPGQCPRRNSGPAE